MKSNILFIVIDSLRADKILGKEKTSVTPNIDNLKKTSITFCNAFSCSDGTLSSMTSMFTSKFFFKTGVSIKNEYNLNSKTNNLVKTLQENGYFTIGLTPKISYLNQITKYFQNEDKTYDYNQNLSNGLGNRIIQKISTLKKEPWFYYIHINDLHLPNWPSKEFDRNEFGKNRYERVISQVDHWIGKIFDMIDKENTIVVLTADHGDFVHWVQTKNKIIDFETKPNIKFIRKILRILPLELRMRIGFAFDKFKQQSSQKKIEQMNLNESQKRALTHTRSQLDHYFYDDLIHVPLIFSSSKIKPKITDDLVRTVDIFPTILELIGCKQNGDMDGRSLVPIINNEKLEEKPVYMERELMLKHSELDVCGIRTSEWKYFRSVSDVTKKIHLFNLKNDPLEENNIAQNEIKKVKEMETMLTEIKKNSVHRVNQSVDNEDHDKKVKDELRKLGYI